MSEPPKPEDVTEEPSRKPFRAIMSEIPEVKAGSGAGGFLLAVFIGTPILAAGWLVAFFALLSVFRIGVNQLGRPSIFLFAGLLGLAIFGLPAYLAWRNERSGLAAGLATGFGLLVLGFGVLCGGMLFH